MDLCTTMHLFECIFLCTWFLKAWRRRSAMRKIWKDDATCIW